jgi:hypothetical protein
MLDNGLKPQEGLNSLLAMIISQDDEGSGAYPKAYTELIDMFLANGAKLNTKNLMKFHVSTPLSQNYNIIGEIIDNYNEIADLDYLLQMTEWEIIEPRTMTYVLTDLNRARFDFDAKQRAWQMFDLQILKNSSDYIKGIVSPPMTKAAASYSPTFAGRAYTRIFRNETVAELRNMARHRGYKGYSSLRKAELITFLKKGKSPRKKSPRKKTLKK